MPFDDVAMGMLAHRCGVKPSSTEDTKLVSEFRTPFKEEKKLVLKGLKIPLDKLPAPNMAGKIVQHQIFDTLDMHQHWDHLNDPRKYIEPRGCWRRCSQVKNKNIILLDHYGAEGLNDRGWIFKNVVELAGYLCATVLVPPPRTMVSHIR